MPPKSKQRCNSKEKQLDSINMKELRSLAKSNGVKGYSSMKKAELVSFLCSKLTMKKIKRGGVIIQ